MKNSKKIGIVLVFFSIVIWLIWAEVENLQLKNNYKFTWGTVSGITSATYKNNNRSVLYDYEVLGKKYKGENSFSTCNELTSDQLRILLVNKKFPVAYAVKNNSTSLIIISEKQALIFKYPTSDSLKIYDSILNCK